MRTIIRVVGLLLLLMLAGIAVHGSAQDVKEKSVDGLNGVKIKVRMEGPYTADTPLQVVCYFRYTPEGAKRMSGAPVELDKKLGSIIASLRERGEFLGDELETLLIIPPKESIKAEALLLVGLGAEENLSLALLERVGRVSLREAANLGTTRVAFAPLIRDQGNSKFSAGNVEIAVVKDMSLAYDTHKRMQKEGLARSYTLEEWAVEAGPAYFDETARAVETAIQQAKAAVEKRPADAYGKGK